MGFKAGDVVQLKEKRAGRYYKGKVTKIIGKELQVSLPNGCYAQLPEEFWINVEDNEQQIIEDGE